MPANRQPLLLLWLVLGPLVAGLLGIRCALAQTTVARHVVAAGGQRTTAGVYEVRATLGQALAGTAAGSAVEVRAGFWPGNSPVVVAVPGGEPATPAIPRAFGLAPPRPNPLTATTSIAFDLPVAARARLAIYDVRGARVKTLVDRALAAGRYTEVWDGASESGEPVRAGVYFFRFEAAGFRASRTIARVR